jgi:hypothetical protein
VRAGSDTITPHRRARVNRRDLRGLGAPPWFEQLIFATFGLEDRGFLGSRIAIWPLRLGSVFGRILVRDPIHYAVSEGDAIDGLGKTPIIDQVGKPCLA